MNILIWYIVFGVIWGSTSVAMMYINYKNAPNMLFRDMLRPSLRDYLTSFSINTILWPVTFLITVFLKD